MRGDVMATRFEARLRRLEEYARQQAGPTEEDLQDLLSFIRGEGQYAHHGTGIHTYPTREGNERSKYEGCLELEKRGLIRRHIDEPDHVCFMPIETGN